MIPENTEQVRRALTRIVDILDGEWPCRPMENNPNIREDAFCVVLTGDNVVPFYYEPFNDNEMVRQAFMIGYTKKEWARAVEIIAKEKKINQEMDGNEGEQ